MDSNNKYLNWKIFSRFCLTSQDSTNDSYFLLKIILPVYL